MLYTRSLTILCPCCHEPTSPADLDGLTDDAARAGDLRPDAEVCRSCRRDLEARAEEYALEDANAEADLDGVFDELARSYREHLDAMLSALDADHDLPSLPGSLAWCREDGAMAVTR